MKIVINTCYGGYGLSKEALEYLGIPFTDNGFYLSNVQDTFNSDRSNPKLVQCIEALGLKTSERNAKLVVIEIPDNIDWVIEEYAGVEWVAEKHRRWDETGLIE